MTKFQIIFFGTLIVIVLAAVIIFSLGRTSNTTHNTVVMWGQVSSSDFAKLQQNIKEKTGTDLNVNYVQKTPAQLDSGLAEAIAAGTGPDLILLPQDLIVKQGNKILPISYQTYSERTFKDTFIQEGELYLTSAGILGLPFQVDPMVLYWNRDMLSAAGIANPPKNWTELPTFISKLTKKDEAFNISKSAIALGEFSNVTNAKNVIATLIMQAGNPITQISSLQRLESQLNNRSANQKTAPAESALNFYTQFSNPSLPVYTWNRSLRNSGDAFTAEDVALYPGFASEYKNIEAKNPNLNFDVTLMPQVSLSQNTNGTKVTSFGNMLAIAIVKTTPYPTDALAAAETLTGIQSEAMWRQISGLPPTRKDLLSQNPGDDKMSVFYTAAIQSSAWLDPNSAATNGIFQELVDSISSGQRTVSEAINTASLELDALTRKN